MLLRRFYEDKLAQASYMIGCQATGMALVVDPHRDSEVYLRAAAEEGLVITYVSETHIHADYLSGARQLARRSDATLLLSGEGGKSGSTVLSRKSIHKLFTIVMKLDWGMLV